MKKYFVDISMCEVDGYKAYFVLTTSPALFEWNLKTVDCLDLRITPTQEFLNSIKKPFAISSFSYTGTFTKNEKVFC